MTIKSPGSQIGFSDVNSEIGVPSSTPTSLNFLHEKIKQSQRTPQPQLSAFYGLNYYLRNVDGNCNNANINNCNCNSGNINCSATANCVNINCANCDTQEFLQSNCNCACTYNCTSNQNCFTYNCNCSKIICTKLYDIGLLPKNIFEADQAFGTELIKNHPDIYNGYVAWAQIVVDWMSGKGPKMMPWMTDEEFSKSIKVWSTNWTQDIATPWANWMAYKMGIGNKSSKTGLALMIIGTPLCKVIGMWQRIVGKSKKPAGFITGLSLIAIFAVLKLVATIGKAIEK